MSSSLLLLTVSIISVLSSSATVVDVAEYLWSGVGAYIVVDRQQVQKKLDDYHRLHTEGKLKLGTHDWCCNLHFVYFLSYFKRE